MTKERLERAWEAICAERRKAIALTALLGVALIMWARAGFTLAGPSSAGASQVQPAPEGGSPGVLATTSEEIASVRERLSRREVTLPRPSGPTRDLFALTGAFVPPEPPEVATGEVSPKSQTPPDDTDAVRREEDRFTRIAQVRDQARRLQLRSIIVGKQPAVVIGFSGGRTRSSLVLRPGQSVDGFTLTAIHPDRALLVKEGVTVELRLEMPR